MKSRERLCRELGIPPEKPIQFIPAAFRISDAANYLGVGRNKIYELTRAGKLRSAKLDGRRVVLRQSMDDFLEEQANYELRQRLDGAPAKREA